jgi:GTPase SAR1 family protein
VYDCSNQESFDNLSTWLNELDTYATKKDIVKMLVGNKIDKPNRVVTRTQGERFARKHAMLFVEARYVRWLRCSYLDRNVFSLLVLRLVKEWNWHLRN